MFIQYSDLFDRIKHATKPMYSYKCKHWVKSPLTAVKLYMGHSNVILAVNPVWIKFNVEDNEAMNDRHLYNVAHLQKS